MKISIILAHPAQGSFNHAIAQTASETLTQCGHTVYYHDLYEEGFDPVLTNREIPKEASVPAVIDRYCQEMIHSDGLIFVHPNWWGMPPAILKGWIDRVIRPGIAYEFLDGDQGEGVPNGLLANKKVMVWNTSNTNREREKTAFGDPLEGIWKNCIFGLCGITDFYRRMFEVIVVSSEEQRAAWLKEVRDVLLDRFG